MYIFAKNVHCNYVVQLHDVQFKIVIIYQTLQIAQMPVIIAPHSASSPVPT